MSETTSRPAPVRSRGSGRGRGGLRGSTRGRDRPTNGTYKDSAGPEDFADQGELGEMKKQYSSQLPMLKELFGQDWTDVDLLFALQETDGDLESTIERISEGQQRPCDQLITYTNVYRRTCFQIFRCEEHQGKVEAKDKGRST